MWLPLTSIPLRRAERSKGCRCTSLDQLDAVVGHEGIELGLVAVPAGAAQQAADRLVAAGVSGILNFAPVTLNLPDHVSHVGVDLATELEQLCFSVANRTRNER